MRNPAGRHSTVAGVELLSYPDSLAGFELLSYSDKLAGVELLPYPDNLAGDMAVAHSLPVNK